MPRIRARGARCACLSLTQWGAAHGASLVAIRQYVCATCRATAVGALRAFPGGLHLGGGVTTDNATEWLDAGAAQDIPHKVHIDGHAISGRVALRENSTCVQAKDTKAQLSVGPAHTSI